MQSTDWTTGAWGRMKSSFQAESWGVDIKFRVKGELLLKGVTQSQVLKSLKILGKYWWIFQEIMEKVLWTHKEHTFQNIYSPPLRESVGARLPTRWCQHCRKPQTVSQVPSWESWKITALFRLWPARENIESESVIM